MSIVDILFLATAGLLFFVGLKNGAITSIITLLAVPVGLGVALFFGPQFTGLLANSGLPATPMISYIVLFLGTILILNIVGTILRGVFQSIPVLGALDPLLGGILGLIQAWAIWLLILIVLGNFLKGLTDTTGALPFKFEQIQQWVEFYNQAVNNSLFAQVNSFVVQQNLPLPKPPQVNP